MAAALAPRAGATPHDFALQTVATGLKQAGARARRGYVIDGFAVDIAMPDTHVALDVVADGWGDASVPSSASAVTDAQKATYLSSAGWRYVQLDYKRWRGLGRGEKLGTLIHLIRA